MSERDKFLTEAMGELWHEWVIESATLRNKHPITGALEYWGHGYECHCGFRRVNRVNWHIGDKADLSHKCININFSDWSGFGKLREWAQGQEWFEDFGGYDYAELWRTMVNPDRFADAIFKFLKERES